MKTEEETLQELAYIARRAQQEYDEARKALNLTPEEEARLDRIERAVDCQLLAGPYHVTDSDGKRVDIREIPGFDPLTEYFSPFTPP